MTTEKRLITVFGATGTQGGAVTRSLLTNPSFRVRGTTRNPSSEKAKALAALGVEVVQAEGFDADSMKAAFEGSWGVFLNTDSNDPSVGDGHAEFNQGKVIVDAAVSAGVEHMVYSSLPSCKEKAGIPCVPFDTKNKIEQYIRQQPFKTSSFVYLGWFMENILTEITDGFRGGFPRHKDEEGWVNLKFARWGDANGAPYVAVTEDLGWIVHGIFLDPEAVNGKTIHGGSEELHYPEFVKIFTDVTGVKARYIEIPFEEIPTFGVRVLGELIQMFRYVEKLDGRYMGEDLDLKTTEGLLRKALKAVGKEERGLTTWREWLETHKDKVVPKE